MCVCVVSAELFSSSPADEVTALVCGAFECSVRWKEFLLLTEAECDPEKLAHPFTSPASVDTV